MCCRGAELEAGDHSGEARNRRPFAQDFRRQYRSEQRTRRMPVCFRCRGAAAAVNTHPVHPSFKVLYSREQMHE
jgi:hypothetical protein